MAGPIPDLPGSANIIVCTCGSPGYLMLGEGYYWVTCSKNWDRVFKDEVLGCWAGPVRDTKEEAIEAWNELMSKYSDDFPLKHLEERPDDHD